VGERGGTPFPFRFWRGRALTRREYGAFIKSLNHLNPELWTTNINTDITFADDDIRQLCQRFRLPQEETVQTFREFVDN